MFCHMYIKDIADTQTKSLALQRIYGILLILEIPYIFYCLVYTSWINSSISIFAYVILFVLYFLYKNQKIDWAMLLSCVVFYPLMIVAPLISYPIKSVLIFFIAQFILVSYISKARFIQWLNAIFFCCGAIYHITLFNYIDNISVYNPVFISEIILGVIGVFVIMYMLYLLNKQILFYKSNLKRTAQFLQEISDLNPHFIFAKDINRKFTYANRSLLDKLGIEEQDLIGKTWEEAIISQSERFNQQVKKDDQTVLETGTTVFRALEKFLGKQREEVYLETYKTPILNDQGRITGILGVATDVSQRMTVESQLKKSEERYRTIFEGNQFGIITGQYGAFMTVNDTFCEMTGYTKTEIEQKELTDIIHPEDYEEKADEVNARLEKGEKGIEFKNRFIRKDGTIRHAIVRIHALKDAQDELTEWVATVADISQLVAMRQALLESEERFRMIVENALVAIIGIDEKGMINTWNKQAEYIFGWEKEEILGKNIQKIIPAKHRAGLIRFAQNGELKHKNKQIELEGLRKNGEHFPLVLALANLQTQHGHIVSAFIRDISEEKRQAKLIDENMLLLNSKNEELKKYIDSNMQLENFAYFASHDLKAPIRTIVSFSQLLERSAKDKLNKDEKEYLDFMVSASKNMQKLIEDLLMYSKVNTHNHKIEKLQLPNLIEQITIELTTIIAEKQAQIIIKYLPTFIYADKTQMRQLFQNFIQNAIKFQRKGIPPIITINCLEQPLNWLFSISDNGIGIEKEFQHKVFLLFRKLVVETEGTGIGLALCKKIVEQHEGQIWLESTYGEGTTFYFTIDKALIKKELELEGEGV